MIMKQLLLFMTVILLAGCDVGMDGDQQARKSAGDWADAYFNCDFKDASGYVTPESQKWLQYAASNITAEELKLLQKAGGAQVTVDDGFDEANDTMRLVTLNVTNSLKPSAQGKAELVKNGTFKVVVVKREAGWQVRMAGLPRSGKQSRD
jgi:hypothetical protein